MNPPLELVAFLDALPEPRILVDMHYRILAANTAYRREFGSVEQPVGRTCFDVSHHFDRPCDQCAESCPRQSALRSGEPHRVLHLHQTPRGEEYVDVELVPIRDASGRIAWFVETLRFLKEVGSRPRAMGMVGRSPAFNRLVDLINRAAPSMTPVLLLGESGTGKELAAQALHTLSPRRSRPFVPVDCSGLTETLFESELFGYEKGAFTGAQQRKTGLVESAAGGTLFLDEIGDVPLSLQVKLLRLLENGTYRRVGGIETLRADFRLVAATHRDLKRMVEAGEFRRDLYYRIAAFPIHLPPLRARPQDLELLIDSLLERLAPGRALRLDPAALAALQDYPFPGNIRELRNLLERAILLTDGDTIGVEHLTEELTQTGQPGAALPTDDLLPLEEVEHRYLTWALRQVHGDKKQLAMRLGISERTLYRKLHGV